jgi:hypothetical protein
LKCERSFGSSHVGDGGGDTHQPKQSFQVREQRPNQWLVRGRLEITQYESKFNMRRQEQKDCLRDLKHYLNQEWRFAAFLHDFPHMGPGRTRDKAIEIFWISVYNGSYHPDYDMLERRCWALAESLCLRDEVEDRSPQVGPELGVDPWGQWRHRSSAVTGMGGLALD